MLAETIFGALLDAEQMQSNALALLESSGLKAEDLDFPDEHRLSLGWRIVEALARRRKPVTAKTVWSFGHASKTFGEADAGYFSRLQVGNELDREQFEQVVENFRAVVRHRSLLATLEQYVGQLREKKLDVPSAAAALEAYLRDLQAYTTADGTGEDDVLEIADDWARQEAGEVTNIVPTGIKTLDSVILGWRPSLNIIAAQPGVGKSALLASCIEAQIDLGFTVGLFGLEDATRWVAQRLIARDMRVPVGEIGIRRRDHAIGLKFQEVAAAHAAKLRKLITYRHDQIDTDELCRRGASWVYNRKVGTVYVDNGSEVEHEGKAGDPNNADQFRLKVAHSYRRMRSTAISTNTPWVVLVHTARPTDNFERPPRPSEIAESAYIERRARVIVGLWEREKEPDFLRLTVMKNTLGKRGQTIKLARYVESALVDRDVGDLVNLESERWAEARAAKERKAAEQAHEKELKKAAADKLKSRSKPAQLETTEPGAEG
jgi:replicative DNA helicase